MEAKARGAKVIHIDPRFTRTSAVADLHVPLRAGSDIAFLGGIINYILSNEKYFHDYVVAYTNAATILREDFRDVDDLDGVFSGYDPETGSYDTSLVDVRGRRRSTPQPACARAPGQGGGGTRSEGEESAQTPGGRTRDGWPRCGDGARPGAPGRDAAAPALRVPGAQAALRPLHPGDGAGDLRRARRSTFLQVCEAVTANSGRDRTTAGSTRSAGPTTRSACSTSAARRSSSCCWATWAARAAGSWRCAGTPASRARPTSRRCSTCCRATCRCPRPASTTPCEDYIDSIVSTDRRASGAPPTPTRSACSSPTGATRRPRRTTSASTTCPG